MSRTRKVTRGEGYAGWSEKDQCWILKFYQEVTAGGPKKQVQRAAHLLEEPPCRREEMTEQRAWKVLARLNGKKTAGTLAPLDEQRATVRDLLDHYGDLRSRQVGVTWLGLDTVPAMGHLPRRLHANVKAAVHRIQAAARPEWFGSPRLRIADVQWLTHLKPILDARRAERKPDGSPRYAEDTISGYRRVLAAAWNKALEHGRIHRTPRPQMPNLPPRKKRERCPSRPEMLAILDAFENPVQRAIFEWLSQTGYRLMEVGELRWDFVHAAAGPGGEDLLFIPGAARKAQHPLGRPLIERDLIRLLAAQRAAQPAGCPWVFPKPGGDRPYTPEALQYAFRVAQRRAGIREPYIPHDLRRYGYLQLNRAGVVGEVTRFCVGHESAEIAADYQGATVMLGEVREALLRQEAFRREEEAREQRAARQQRVAAGGLRAVSSGVAEDRGATGAVKQGGHKGEMGRWRQRPT